MVSSSQGTLGLDGRSYWVDKRSSENIQDKKGKRLKKYEDILLFNARHLQNNQFNNYSIQKSIQTYAYILMLHINVKATP